MALPVPNQAAATIVGTVLAAVGLNLGVLGLVTPDTVVEQNAEVAAQAETTPVVQETTVPVTPEGLAQAEGDAPNQIVALALPRPADSAGTEPEVETTQGSSDQSTSSEPATSSAAPTTSASLAQASTKPAPAKSDDRPSTMAPATTAVPTTAPPTTAPPTTAAPTSQSNSTEFITYEFEGVATIIVALHDGDTLELWSVARQPGWVSRVDDDEANKVKIKFMRLSDGEEAEFEVRFDREHRGELKVEMER